MKGEEKGGGNGGEGEKKGGEKEGKKRRGKGGKRRGKRRGKGEDISAHIISLFQEGNIFVLVNHVFFLPWGSAPSS
jgi:hypothetical protein